MKVCISCGYKNPPDSEFCNKCGSRLTEGKDSFIGIIIDRRYEVVSKIAEGGMGTVYRGRDVRLEKDVALKILHPELARDKKFLARFRNEAITVAKLEHPNIVRVHDTGPVRDTYFIAMDFLDGEDLVELIKKRGRLSVDEAFSIAGQVAEGLAYAHERGVLHRDVKPANIIVDRSGKAVITDFGIAKAMGEKGQTTTGTAVGTPEYMSLEQVKGLELDERTDIYSLGVVLYEMLTGKSPFRSDTGISTIAKILSEEAPPIERVRPDLPGWAVEVVNRLIKKNRDKRYSSTIEIIAEIVHLDGLSTRVMTNDYSLYREMEQKGTNPQTERTGKFENRKREMVKGKEKIHKRIHKDDSMVPFLSAEDIIQIFAYLFLGSLAVFLYLSTEGKAEAWVIGIIVVSTILFAFSTGMLLNEPIPHRGLIKGLIFLCSFSTPIFIMQRSLSSLAFAILIGFIGLSIGSFLIFIVRVKKR